MVFVWLELTGRLTLFLLISLITALVHRPPSATIKKKKKKKKKNSDTRVGGLVVQCMQMYFLILIFTFNISNT